MTIKELIDELRTTLKEISREYEETGDNYYKGMMSSYAGIIYRLENIDKEEQAKYGKDEDDYFESKIAEEREG